METTMISPSAEARQLFNRMSARAQAGRLNLMQTLLLSVDLRKEKDEPHASVLHELQREDWITALPDGGWDLSMQA